MKKKVSDDEKKHKTRVSRAQLSLKSVNLERLQRQLENVVGREAVHLLKLSHEGKLDKDSATAACNYLKLIKDLRKEESKNLEDLSDEELEKLQKNGK